MAALVLALAQDPEMAQAMDLDQVEVARDPVHWELVSARDSGSGQAPELVPAAVSVSVSAMVTVSDSVLDSDPDSTDSLH